MGSPSPSYREPANRLLATMDPSCMTWTRNVSRDGIHAL